MKIGQFSDTFLPVVDGVGRVVSNYARLMAPLCEAVYVITPLQTDLYKGGLPFDIIDFCGFPLPRMKHYRAGLPSVDIHYLLRVAHAKMDIIHTHSPFVAGQEAFRIAQKQKIPVVGTFHSKYFYDFYQLSRSNTLSKMGSNLVADYFEKCDQVWAVNQSAADELLDYGFRGKYEIVENGTERKTVDPAAIERVDQAYQLGSSPVLLYVGQMNWKKNIIRILESASLLHNQGFDFKLVMAGQGPSEHEIRNTANSLGLGDTVILTGHIEDPKLLDGLYARANLFVFPSLYDTTALVVHEAAALGTPSILVRGSSVAQVVRDNWNGLLAEDRTDDLAARIAWALQNPDHLAEIGQNATNSIPRYWDEIIEGVMSRYNEIIEFKKRLR